MLYVDDCLCIAGIVEEIIRDEIGKYFHLKEESIGEPKIYLGNKVSKVKLSNGVSAWSLSSSRYVQEAVKCVETHLIERGLNLMTRAPSPSPKDCRPELDVSPELDVTGLTY